MLQLVAVVVFRHRRPVFAAHLKGRLATLAVHHHLVVAAAAVTPVQLEDVQLQHRELVHVVLLRVPAAAALLAVFAAHVVVVVCSAG